MNQINANQPQGQAQAPDFLQMIQRFEKRQLDYAVPSSKPIWGAKIEKIPYFRVLGQASFWERDGMPIKDYEIHMEDLIAGIHGQGHAFAYLVLSTQKEFCIYIGLRAQKAEATLLPPLQGTFPGIILSEQANTKLGSYLNSANAFSFLGRLTGIPTSKSGTPTAQPHGETSTMPPAAGNIQQIERLMRGLSGKTWGYLVWAEPLLDSQTVQNAHQSLKELTRISPFLHQQINKQETTTKNVTNNESYNQSTSESWDKTNHEVKYTIELLERSLQRYNTGKSQGMWGTDVHFFAPEIETLRNLKSLLRAVYSGENSTPEPLRTFECSAQNTTGNDSEFVTPLTSSELATLCQLPREEFSGYEIRDYALFDVHVPVHTSDKTPIAIGSVLDGNHSTGNWFTLPQADFAKHGLIVGVTGSGKTNTIFDILTKNWMSTKIPFLVIEPAKTEYRNLLGRGVYKSHMRVYTLGDERYAPFRLNPFAFEIFNEKTFTHVQTHIDFLKSVFNAAFVLYAPMPYVLEVCLHEIYQDKGWDLVTGQNKRLPIQERSKAANYPIFPTLSELYFKVDEVVERLGYDDRITSNVKAALKARIGSLRLGGKGLMLDTPYGLSMQDLLSTPTVLELERIGSDDEKAFIIGLVLTRLYEYRILQSKHSGQTTHALQHITVFEEAHRLLKNTRTEVGQEEANTRAQAVETFANMLSEIRAYGQGILIAEQIPTKLAQDAIKNTNLKIMHRVVAADDREVMGATMNLSVEQSKLVASLAAGQAVIYAEGNDRPSLVRIPRQPEKDPNQIAQAISDVQVHSHMQPFCKTAALDPVPGFSLYLGGLPPETISELCDLAQTSLTHPEFPAHFTPYFLGLLLDPGQAVSGLNRLLTFIRRSDSNLKPNQEKNALVTVLLYALNNQFEARGRQYRWFYNVSSNLQARMIAKLLPIVQAYENKKDVVSQLTAQANNDLKAVTNDYLKQTKRKTGPFVSFVLCKDCCNYRWDLAYLVTDRANEQEFARIIRENPGDNKVVWQQLASMISRISANVLPTHHSHFPRIALCLISQLTARLGLSAESQVNLARQVSAILAQSNSPQT